MEHMNQKLKQYLQFFIDHKQKNWSKWLVSAKFAINNKAHTTTKMSLFIANYGRELRMGIDIRRRGKIEKATEFAGRMKKLQEKAGTVLRNVQKEMK